MYFFQFFGGIFVAFFQIECIIFHYNLKLNFNLGCKMKIVHKFSLTALLILGLSVSSTLIQESGAATYTNLMENKTAQSQISDLSMYRLVFSKDNIPVNGNTSVGSASWYNYADTTGFASGWNGAIFYFQDTTNAGATEWVLTDAPNYSGTNMYQLGISRKGNASDVVNRVITGSNVYTSYTTANMPLFAGVTPDANNVSSITGTNIILEFWPFNYDVAAQSSKLDQDGNAFPLSTAHTTGYDWNDTPSTGGDHGSWQIHLYDSATGTGQTLVGLSRLYREGSGETSNIVIGNSSSAGALDGTMVTNKITNENRSLQVLAIPNYVATDRIFNATASGTDWNAAANWYDSTASTASTAPSAANDVFVNAGNVTVSGTSTGNILNVGQFGTVTVAGSGNLTLSGTKFIGGTTGTVNYVGGLFQSSGNVTMAADLQVTAYGALRLSGGTLTTPNLIVAIGANTSASFDINSGTTVTSSGSVQFAYAANSAVTGTISDSNIFTKNIYFGNSGNATVEMNNAVILGANGAANSNVTDFHISVNASSTSTVVLNGAGTNIRATNFNVGYRGNGTLIMNNGSITCTSYYCIGNNNSAAMGTVHQYGGSVTTPWAPLGHNGKGVYNLYGGTFHVTGTGAMDGETSTNGGLEVGDRVGSSVTFNQYGGTVSSAGYVYIGRVGTGTYNLVNGNLTANNGISIGHLKNSTNPGSGTFTMDDGTVTTGGNFIIGNNTNGTFTQNGGKVTVSNTVHVGNSSSSTSSYTMNGGTLSAKNMAVGNYGSGTFNLYNGTVATTEWFLVGFQNGKGFATPNTANQYGGTMNLGWFTLGWDTANSDGTYNMYGGTLTTKGNGNPMVIAKSGKGTFNLYNGNVTLAAATSSNQGSASGDYIGYALKLGYAGTGNVNIYAGDIAATGNVSIGATSTLHFEPTVQGIGSLSTTGSLTQAAGGVISVSGTNAIAFLDNYSVQNGVDIMTVGGKNALTVTNSSSSQLTTSYSTDTGILNLKLNSDGYLGAINATSDSISFDPTETGWISLNNFGGTDPYEIALRIDTTNMNRDAFIGVLNTEMQVGDETYLTATAGLNDDEVVLHFMPDLVDADVFMWNFSDAALYNGGVALTGLSMGAVPEPSSWVLLGLGILALAGFRRSKNTILKSF